MYEFHVAFDHEINAKKGSNVRKLETDLADQISLIASTVIRLDWDAQIGKGLDDLLLVNGDFTYIEHVRSEKVQAVQPIIDYMADIKKKNTISRFTLAQGRTALTYWINQHGPGGRHVSGVALNRSDAGLGKTRENIFLLLRAINAGNRERLAIFFDDYARIAEFLVMITRVLDERDAKKVLNELAIIKGRNEDNCLIYHEKVELLQERGRNVSRYACGDCDFKNECDYHKQFDVANEATYTLATHANMGYLMTGYANNEKLPAGYFDHIIIDENSTTSLYSTIDWTIARLQAKSNYLQILLDQGAIAAAEAAEQEVHGDKVDSIHLDEATRSKIQDVKRVIDALTALLLENSAKRNTRY